MSNKKTLLIIAGPNGAGKTTIAPELQVLYNIDEAVNPDIVATGLSLHPESVAFQAGRIALNRLHHLIKLEQSFCYETTLASHTIAHIMSIIDQKNYIIRLHFLALSSTEIAIQRVRYRVEQGGHNIAIAVIKRRYYRGLANFFQRYQHSVDEWFMYNGEQNGEIIAAKYFGISSAEIYQPLLWSRLEKIGHGKY